MGSIAVFSEKYGDVVRVVDVSPFDRSFVVTALTSILF